MAKNKLFRFEENKKMEHFFQPSFEEVKNGDIHSKGNWKKDFFNNDNPIVLELGCGKGEYAVGLARKYPNINIVAIDIKGSRMYVGAKQAEDEGLKNIIFLRTKVDLIEHFFAAGEVHEIWLTFSDPQKEKPRKRLTSPLFIKRYQRILTQNGLVHLKTDSDLLFEYTVEEIKANKYTPLYISWDIYKDMPSLPENDQEILKIQTHYEKLFSEKGAIIKYCKFIVH